MGICRKACRFVKHCLVVCILTLKVECVDIAHTSGSSNCTFTKDSYMCTTIPASIPLNVTSVVVTGFKGDSFFNKFTHHTWKHIKRLDLTGNHVIRVAGFCFTQLNSLTALTLKLRFVVEFKSRIFAGLHNVQKLELLNMAFLQTPLLSALIETTDTLPVLRELTFDPGKVDMLPTVELRSPISDAILAQKQLKSVNISNCLILTTVMTLLKTAISSVETLNISGSTVIYISEDECSQQGNYALDSSNMHKPIFRSVDVGQITHKPIFRTIDVSRITYSSPTFLTDGPQPNLNRITGLIENIYADNILYDQKTFNVSFNYTMYPVFLKTVSYRGNHIKAVRGSLVLNTLCTVDWSDNLIAYISPDSVSSLVHLEVLNLSGNKLYQMQTNSYEFRRLFKMQTELKVLDLSYNAISLIPYEMFEHNVNLQLLNLSYNELTTVMFGLKKLRHLIILDLSGNQIHSIEGQYLLQLQQYIAMMQNNSHSVTLLLDVNPLVCACNTVDFIQWLNTFASLNRYQNSYFCFYEGKRQRINQPVVDRSKYLCRREMIIIVSVLVSSVLLLVILLVTGILIKIRRKRKQIDREYQFRKKYRQSGAEQFMVFLAYASVDEHIVRNHVITPLNETLISRLGTNRDTIATGYNFRPGFRITEEIFRLIELSHIFIAVVSNKFCRSEFCVGELHEACKQEKPMILVFSGEVDENNMSPYLREVFKRVVRAKLVTDGNGVMQLIPSVKNICESVMMLAMTQHDS